MALLAAAQVQPLEPARPRQRRPAAKRPATFRQQQQAAGQPGSANSLGGPQLTRRLQDAEPSQQVVALVQQAGPQCNAYHFTTAVNRVAKLHDRQPKASNQAAFAALLAFAEQHPAIVNHVAVAQTVWAGGVLRHRLTAQQQAAWQERLVWAFAHPELLPKQLANGLWGWSRMGLTLQGQQAATAADAAIQRVAEQMTSQGVANTLVAFANGSWQLGSAAAAALLQQLEQVLPQAQPQAVANSLWALSKLGLRLSDSLAAAADAAIQRVSEQMIPQHVANTQWAFANGSWQLSSAAAAALLQRLEQVLPQANAQDVANSLWAAAKLGLRLSGSLKAAFVQALRRIMPAAKAIALSNSVLACGLLRWSPGEGVLEAGVAAMQRCLGSEHGMDCQALDNFLWGLAELQRYAGAKVQLLPTLPTLLEAAGDWAGSRWGQLSALDVCDLCYNLARLGHRPDGTWIAHAAQRCALSRGCELS